MVVISFPDSVLILVTHDRIAFPFWCTVQAPLRAMPQPQDVAQIPQQWQIGIAIEGAVRSIHFKRDHVWASKPGFGILFQRKRWKSNCTDRRFQRLWILMARLWILKPEYSQT